MSSLADRIIHLILSRDPDVERQGWELCAVLSVEERMPIAQLFSVQYRWGLASQVLLPDQSERRSQVLILFSIDCIRQAIPILESYPLLSTFCEEALDQLQAQQRPGNHKRAREVAYLRKRGLRELRFALRDGGLPHPVRLILDATQALVVSDDGAVIARTCTAHVRRAMQEAGYTGTIQWQQKRFYDLFLPLT